jgi:hypothetical protein
VNNHDRRLISIATGAVLVLLAGACRESGDAATPDTDANRQQPGYVIDSILPMDENFRRFRAGLDSVATLSGGAPSADSLVRSLLTAIATRDTALARELVLNRAEFAWSYYPDHELAKPPYEISPAFLWSQIQNGSTKGITRLFTRFGGRDITYRGLNCDADRIIERGRFREREYCLVSFHDAQDGPSELRMFAAIVERDGRFKFLSYANDF